MENLVVLGCSGSCDDRIKNAVSSAEKLLTETVQVFTVDSLCDNSPGSLPDITSETKLLLLGCPILTGDGYKRIAEHYGKDTTDIGVVDLQRDVISVYGTKADLGKTLARIVRSGAALLADRQILPAKASPVNNDVLIYGCGISAIHAAENLVDNSGSIDFIDTRESAVSPGSYDEVAKKEILAHEQVGVLSSDSIGDMSRSFEGVSVTMIDGTHRKYGSFVFAPERLEPESPEPGSLNLAQCFDLMKSQRFIRGDVVILADYGWLTTPEVFQDILTAALFCRKELRANVWVLTKEVQVALHAQQALYDRCRNEEIIFIKYTDEVKINNDYGDFSLEIKDGSTGSVVHIVNPEHLVIPQMPKLSENSLNFAAVLGLTIEKTRYSQQDSIWRLPVQTNLRAAFAAGAAREHLDSELQRRDGQNVGYAVRTRNLGFEISEYVPVVDAAKCAYCLTCVRACPFQAMGKNPQEQIAAVDEASCEACGTCVSMCPAGALQTRNMSNDSIRSGLKALL